jgi:hypothetical protein
MKNFNLSEKRQDTNKGTNFIRFAYLEEDIKEFIRLLKKNLTLYTSFRRGDVFMEIDRLIGDKLI